VQNASIEDDDDLQDRWAALLANASRKDQLRTAFVDVLRQLSALVLETVFQLKDQGPHHLVGGFGGAIENLQRLGLFGRHCLENGPFHARGGGGYL